MSIVKESLPKTTESTSLDEARKATRSKSLLHPLMFLATDFRERMRAGLKRHGHQLQPAHSSLIVNLKISGSRLTDMADRAGMTKQAMGKMVDELEELGYVCKQADPQDGRAKIVRFTDKGLALLKNASQVVDEIWLDYAKLIGEEELQDLLNKLNTLQHNIIHQT